MTKRLPLVLVVLVLITGACSKPAAQQTGARATNGSSPSASARASADPSGTTSGAPAPAGNVGGETPLPGAGGDGTPSPRAGGPPAPGTYTYRQSGEQSFAGETRDYPDSGTLQIEPATPARKGFRQEQIRDRGHNQEFSSTLLFRTGSVLLESVTLQGTTCTLRPPLTVIDLPLKTGSSWEDEAVCTAGNMSITFELAAEVDRKETRSVGGVEVETFVVETELTSSSGGFTQTQHVTGWVAPSHGLIVRAETRSDGATGLGQVKDRFVEQLVSLDPK